jgi:hypothetical protein
MDRNGAIGLKMVEHLELTVRETLCYGWKSDSSLIVAKHSSTDKPVYRTPFSNVQKKLVCTHSINKTIQNLLVARWISFPRLFFHG